MGVMWLIKTVNRRTMAANGRRQWRKQWQAMTKMATMALAGQRANASKPNEAVNNEQRTRHEQTNDQ